MTEKEKPSQGAHFAGGILSGFRVEVDPHRDGLSVTVGGVEKILAFTGEAAEFLTVHRRVRITGRGLSLSVFENHAAEVSGTVEGIGFV